MSPVEFLKGHGTGNDFILLPDLDDTLDLTPALVRALCDRRTGIGADGVLRVLRDPEGTWFMDYRNADGSLAQMCGNGARVYAHYLAEAGLADPGSPLVLRTRGGKRAVELVARGLVSVEMGPAVVGALVEIEIAGRRRPARSVDVGNPHAVILLEPDESLADLGPVLHTPTFSTRDFPEGVNVEVVARRGPGSLALRVHERGVGETRSCGTGACAAAVAVGLADGVEGPATWAVGVPGGELTVTRRADGEVVLAGPAVLVARGTLDPAWLAAR